MIYTCEDLARMRRMIGRARAPFTSSGLTVSVSSSSGSLEQMIANATQQTAANTFAARVEAELQTCVLASVTPDQLEEHLSLKPVEDQTDV